MSKLNKPENEMNTHSSTLFISEFNECLLEREAPKSLHWVACGTRYTKNCSVPVNFFKWGVIKTI